MTTAPGSSSRRLSTGKKGAFATLVTVVFLVGLESSARVVEFVRSMRAGPSVETALRARDHPIRFELTPGRGLPANGQVAAINSLGLRGAEPDRTRRRVRVLCLGDSCTFGYAPDVTDQASYPAALGRRLDLNRFETLNGGMPGFGSLDVLDYFVYKGVELRPDVVVILAGWNDYARAQPLDTRAKPAPRSPLDRSAFFRLTREAILRQYRPPPFDLTRERARLAALPVPTDRLDDTVFARTERVLEDLVRLCRVHGATPILVTYPNFTRDEWSNADSLTAPELQTSLSYLLGGELSPRGWRRFATRTNRLILDVAVREEVPLVDGSSLRDVSLFHDICHLNARGCDALARLIAPAVEKSPPRGSTRRPPPRSNRATAGSVFSVL